MYAVVLRDLQDTLATATLVGVYVGAVLGAYLTLDGIRRTLRGYFLVYDRLWQYGPAVLRTAMLRQDATRGFAHIVAYPFFGLILVVGSCMIGSCFFALLFTKFPGDEFEHEKQPH